MMKEVQDSWATQRSLFRKSGNSHQATYLYIALERLGVLWGEEAEFSPGGGTNEDALLKTWPKGSDPALFFFFLWQNLRATGTIERSLSGWAQNVRLHTYARHVCASLRVATEH